MQSNILSQIRILIFDQTLGNSWVPPVADMPLIIAFLKYLYIIGLWHFCNTLHAMEKAGAVSS